MTRTILIVDDDPLMRELLAETVGDLADVRLLAESGRQALALIRTTRVDLVISDVFMPGEDGIGFINRLKALHLDPGPPVILISGSATPGFDPLGLGRKLGAAAVFPKPIDHAALLAEARRLLLD